MADIGKQPARRQVKLPMYAAAKIPEYWIINLEQQSIEAYSHPKNGEYLYKTVASAGETIRLAAFRLDIACDEFLLPAL